MCIKTADLALCWHTWHALLADYIISCNAHSCGLQPGLHGVIDLGAAHMAFTSLIVPCQEQGIENVVYGPITVQL